MVCRGCGNTRRNLAWRQAVPNRKNRTKLVRLAVARSCSQRIGRGGKNFTQPKQILVDSGRGRDTVVCMNRYSSLLTPLHGTEPEHLGRELALIIRGGELAPGERLPSEREISQVLGLSRHAVRGALEEVNRQGLIEFQSERIRRVRQREQPGFMATTIAVISQLEWHEHPLVMQGTNKAVLLHAIRAAEENDFHVVSVNPRRLDDVRLARLIVERPRGAVILPPMFPEDFGEQLVRRLQRGGIPVVVRSEEAWASDVDAVYSDHRDGAAQLTRYLLRQGCRRILRVGRPGGGSELPQWLRDRDTGHEQVLKASGIEPLQPVYADLIEKDPDCEEAVAMLIGFLMPHLRAPQPIDAIMLTSDSFARGVAEALRRLGREPGRDIRLVGYDHLHLDQQGRSVTELLDATVDKRDAAIGCELMALLEARTSGQLGPAPEHRAIKPELIVLKENRPSLG